MFAAVKMVMWILLLPSIQIKNILVK